MGKELSIEEKAKRYDKAIERARNTIEVNQTIPDIVECIESLFPELKESEDEKIIKSIINLVKKSNEQGGYALHKDEADKMIAWLEKQGELVDSLSKGTDAEWSEEDEKEFIKSLRPQNNVTDEELAQAKKDAYNEALNKIEYHSGEPTFDDGWGAAIWFLKKRNAMPQKQWKPTEEQLDIIDMILTDEAMDDNVKSILKELKESLKQL